MNRNPAIGFIGFGEAGSAIAEGLRSAGINRLFAFDIQTYSPKMGAVIQAQAQKSQTVLVDSSSELAKNSEILFSTVTASSALEAAQQTVDFLLPGHIYADLNSVSPERKREIASIIETQGSHFVEAAVMAPVLPYGHRVPILLAGPAAENFAVTMAPFGMRLEVIGETLGTAAAVKMCRSIVVKGLEALLFECVLAARHYGADERVFASLNETFPGINWQELANYMIPRVVVHGERRAHEMEEVADMLRAIGIDPITTEAVARRQGWSAQLGLRSQFPAEGPSDYREVVEVIVPYPV